MVSGGFVELVGGILGSVFKTFKLMQEIHIVFVMLAFLFLYKFIMKQRHNKIKKK